MTRDDIIRMAREAGFMVVSEGEPETGAWYECFTEEIERFAALVAAAEREACAKLCESMSLEWEDQPVIAQAELATLMDCALAIRNRSN